jgi:hypothetical protein
VNAELEGYGDQLLAICQDAPGLIGRLSRQQANWRPAAGRWSIAECFAHLNLTAERFLPAFDAAIAGSRARGLVGSGPFVYPWLERLFVQSVEPPPRFRVRTRPGFAPAADLDPADVLREFLAWQDGFRERLRLADGLDLRRARVQSPFFSWLRYSLGTAFAAFLAHERRHVWQAREVRKSLAVGG